MTDTEVSQRLACPKCDKVFERQMQLQGHMTSHATPKPCEICGKEYKTPGALGNHRKREHGVEGTSVATVSARRRRASRPDLDWKADDIFQSVITLLWPGGTVPTGAIIPLIQWREDTQVMLEKIQNE